MSEDITNPLEDIDYESDITKEGKADLAANPQVLKLLTSMAQAIKQVRDILSKGYPYPAAEKKAEEGAELQEQYNELSKKYEALEKTSTEADEKLKSYSEQEKTVKVNALLDLELEKGIISKDNREEMVKEYMTFSDTQLDFLTKKAQGVEKAEIRKKSFKATEPQTSETKDNEKTIQELETFIKDCNQAEVKGPAYDQAVKDLTAMRSD